MVGGLGEQDGADPRGYAAAGQLLSRRRLKITLVCVTSHTGTVDRSDKARVRCLAIRQAGNYPDSLQF